MSTNLIHKYINDATAGINGRQSNRYSYASPSIAQTVYIPTESTNNLIKPLEGKGYLLKDNLISMPKEFVRDTAYSAKALYDGARGKGNDHQLGKMNDLGLKLGGLAIATYLMTHKATPKTKLMEFIGFGSFLASMALWPKLAIEIPTKLIHGFNFRQKYIDEQGRKKYATQDPNYIPFDLYRGETKTTDLDAIGDKLGIPKNTPNRREEVKNEVRKISVQDNTLWMLTAGIATPTMTALLSNFAEKAVAPVAEDISNRSTNKSIDEAHSYLTNRMTNKQRCEFELNNFTFDSKPSPLAEKLASIKGQSVAQSELDAVVDLFVGDFEPEMKDAAKNDIINMLGGQRYTAGQESMNSLAGRINTLISAKDVDLAKTLSAERLETALSEGLMRGAVQDMLADVSREVLDVHPIADSNLSETLKSLDLSKVNFFEVTEETKNMSNVDRLAHNIKKIFVSVVDGEDLSKSLSEIADSNPALKSNFDRVIEERANSLARGFYDGAISVGEDSHYILNSVSEVFQANTTREPKYKKLFSEMYGMVGEDLKARKGYVFTDSSVATLKEAEKHLSKYRIFNEILSKGAHFKVEMAPDTLAANSWNSVTNLLIKELGITDKEISEASKSQKLTRELIERKLEEVCADDAKYPEFIQKIAKKMSLFDEKMETPNSGSNGRMISKLEEGITVNCTEAGNALDKLGLNEMRKKMVSSYSEGMGVNTGSIMNSKLERLHVRVNGIHSSYMRVLQACEFFRRSSKYKLGIQNGTADLTQLAQEYGFTSDVAKNEEIITRGKDLLLSAHTNKFYNKMGTINNPEFFRDMMSAIYNPTAGTNGELNNLTSTTVSILDGVKVNGQTPRRVFETSADGRKPIGQVLREYMEETYKSLGSIGRRIVKPDREALKVGVNKGDVTKNMERASERFNLLGKAPSEMLHDALKQSYNSKKWMKIFAPILGGTFLATVGAQFLFGNKHKQSNS